MQIEMKTSSPLALALGQELTVRYHRSVNLNSTFTWAFTRYHCPKHKKEERCFQPEFGYYETWCWIILPWNYDLTSAKGRELRGKN